MKTAIVLTISQHLRDVLPPPTDDQRAQLEANILADGRITDPLCYWFDGTDNLIVDGMNRFEIAEAHGIEYDVREMTFPDIRAVEIWMLQRQAGRRNNTPQQLSEMRGRLYNLLKTDKNANLDWTDLSKGQIDTSEETLEKPRAAGKNTAETVAEQFDVSPATVKRDGKRVAIIDNLNEGVKKSLGKTVHDAAMADLQKLAKLDLGAQETVARTVRTGQVKTLKEALKTVPAPTAEPKAAAGKKGKATSPPVSGPDCKALYKEWERSIGPLVRLVDRIAGQVNGKNGDHHKTVQDHLNIATEKMMEWLKVSK